MSHFNFSSELNVYTPKC